MKKQLNRATTHPTDADRPRPLTYRHLAGLLLGLAALWLLLSGIETPLLSVLGGLSCVVIAWLCVRMGIVDDETIPLHLLHRLPGYIVWLGREIAVANWAVAKIVARRKMPISPTLIDEDMRAKTELGQVFYANSITLTPGTITVELRDGRAQVHGITRDTAADVAAGGMSRRVDRLERGKRA